MPVEPSLRALARDLIGASIDGDEDDVAHRPSVARALATARPGQVIAARDGAERVALAVLHDGTAYVVPDSCPHDGGLLSDGFIEGRALVCSRHGWELDVCSGRCRHRPLIQLPTKRVS